MDVIDYLSQDKETGFFWYEAKKKLIDAMFKDVYDGYSADRKIFEIGCGTGDNIEILKKYGQAAGSDINIIAVNESTKKGLDVRLMDIEKDEIDIKGYDAICCFDVLEHLDTDQETFTKIYSLLKKNGTFFFTVPAYQFLFSDHDIALKHKRRYNKNELSAKMLKSGFTNIELYYWNVFLFPAIAVMRLFKKIPYPKLGDKKTVSEAKKLPFLLNTLLLKIMSAEKIIFKNNFLPFGLTIFGTAKKN